MSPHQDPITYPPTKRVEQRDDYHGTIVDDPYRWLEDLDSDDTAAFVRAQNDVSFGYLSKVPERDAIAARLTQLWDYPKLTQPFRRADQFFWMQNDGLQNQFVLVTAPDADAQPEVLLDPNTWSDDGTVALGGVAIDEDARYLAYAITHAGSDWNEWRVMDLRTRETLPDHIRWVKFSNASFAHDGSGFFYSGYGAPTEDLEDLNRNHRLYFHRLRTDQADDEIVYARPDKPDWLINGAVDETGRWLTISVRAGSSANNALFLKDLSDPGSDVSELIDNFDAQYGVVEIDGDTVFLQTTMGAPLGRVVAASLSDPAPANWTEMIPEGDAQMVGVNTCGGKWFVNLLVHGCSRVKVYLPDGTFEHEVELPGLASVGGFGGRRHHTDTFYTYTSFTEASATYRYDIASGTSTRFRRAAMAFDPASFESTLDFYTSKDGTRVPIFLVHKKGLVLDGTNPTYLYGYGGFRIPATPGFSPAVIAWMEMGGVFAQPGIRGGSEYGEEWHAAGTKERKQNVFDDFIAAAEWLIEKRYTSTPHLAIAGGSNGGLLVGACITQRPDLFGAARIAVGVLDMLRFHRFTIGWAWVSDYGSADNADDFKYLYAYSPLHNIRAGTAYPPTLIETGDHDDRVVPSHSFKFAATLQPAQGARANPVLLRVDVRAGHGLGKPTTKIIEAAADGWAFVAHHTGASMR
jgi:prolyl oligopeptidase